MATAMRRQSTRKSAAFGVKASSIAKSLPPSAPAAADLTCRQKVYRALEEPKSSRIAGFIAFAMSLAIVVSTVSVVFETEVKFCPCKHNISLDFCALPVASKGGGAGGGSNDDEGSGPDEGERPENLWEKDHLCLGFLPFEPFAMIFYVIEWATTVLFSAESLLRFWACPDHIRYFRNVDHYIDLTAVLPFWIFGSFQSPPFQAPNQALGPNTGGTGFLRAIRLLRVAMTVLGVCGFIAITIFSSVMWLLENPNSPFITPELLYATNRGPAFGGLQAHCFGTIPTTLWWAVTTMTTVGYGDCFPITVLGKLTAVTAMLVGIITLALPITVIGNNFVTVSEMFDDLAQELAQERMKKDGTYDEIEIREFLLRCRREGTLRRDVDTRAQSLLATYGDGKEISLEGFRKMQEAVVLPVTDSTDDISGLEIRQRLNQIEATTAAKFQALDAKLDGLVRLLSSGAPSASPSAGGSGSGNGKKKSKVLWDDQIMAA